MGASFSAEMLKLGKRPASWVLLLFWLALNVVFSYVIPYTSYLTSKSGGGTAGGPPPAEVLAGALPDNMIFSAVAGMPVFAGAVALIFGALSMGGEYANGTLPMILTQRPRRLSVLAGKVCALIAALLGVILVTFAINALASLGIATAESKAATWPPAIDLLKGMSAGWLILSMWSMFGVVLAAVFRGVALPIGLGIMWVVAVQNLISGLAAPLLPALETAQKGLPGANAGSLVVSLFGNDDDTPGLVAVVGGSQATVTLLGYVIAFGVISALALYRRDAT